MWTNSAVPFKPQRLIFNKHAGTASVYLSIHFYTTILTDEVSKRVGVHESDTLVTIRFSRCVVREI